MYFLTKPQDGDLPEPRIRNNPNLQLPKNEDRKIVTTQYLVLTDCRIN